MKMDWPSIDRDVDAVALRGNRRDSMFLKASLYCPRTDHRFDIVVRNVSAGGLLADTPQELPVGEEVRVALRKVGEVPGRVVWSQPARFGIAFEVAIDPQAVRQPVKAPKPRVAQHAAPIGTVPRGRRSPIVRI